MTMRWLVIVALCAACGGKKDPKVAGAAAATSSDMASLGLTVDERIARAAAWLTTDQAEDAQRALDDLSLLLVEEPERVEIPFNMALAYHRLGDHLNARKFYLRTTAVDSTVGSAWLNLGALAEQGGQYKRALQHYRAGLQNDPETGELVVGIIGVLRRLGQHDEAIAEAKSALSRDANNIDVYNNLGLVYIDMNKPDLAQFIYQKALNSIDGAENNPALHANLGRTYLAKDRRWNAKQALEKALELDPDLVPAMMFLAGLAMDDRDWQRTADLLERAVQLEPDNAAIHLNLGIAYRGLGQYELARKEYNEALRIQPEDPSPHINIALLLGNYEDDFDGAIAAIQAYRSRGGEHQPKANALLTDFEKRKADYEADVARKKKREEDRKRREEEARLAAEYEASQEAWRNEQEQKRLAEEEARQRAEAAAAAAAGNLPPESTPVPETTDDADPGATEESSGTPEAEAPVAADPAAAEGAVWGAQTETNPVPEPTNVQENPAPAVATPSAAPERGTRQVGAPCSGDQQCAIGLVCAGGSCASEGGAPISAPSSRGTRVVGAPCSSDNQCTEGLSCVNSACAGSSEAGGSWGGW